MKFDAAALARAWLAVSPAASTDKATLPRFYRTVAIEEHLDGIRLWATDQYMVLTAWVPSLEHHYEFDPGLDVAPERVVIARDIDGRAKGFFGYALALFNALEAEAREVPGVIEINIEFDIRVPAGAAVPETLEGLEPTYTVLWMPDKEKVYLETVGDEWPDLRHLFVEHKPRRTENIRFNPELVERLTKLRKHASGVLAWSFGGQNAPALVSYVDSDPFIRGAVMPRKDVEVVPGEVPDGD